MRICVYCTYNLNVRFRLKRTFENEFISKKGKIIYFLRHVKDIALFQARFTFYNVILFKLL